MPGYVRLTLAEFHDLFRDAEIQYVDNGNQNNANNQQQINYNIDQNNREQQEIGSSTNSPQTQTAKFNDQANQYADENQQQSRDRPELRFDTSLYSHYKHLTDNNLADLKGAASDLQATIVVDGRLMETPKRNLTSSSSSKLRRNLSIGKRKVIAISRNARHLLKARFNSSTKQISSNKSKTASKT